MSTDDRLQALRGALPAIADQEHAAVLLAGFAQLEAETAAALSLYIQGGPGALDRLLGRAGVEGAAAQLVALPVVAAFGAAAEMLNAAVGDDATRGWAALVTLQERAAEYGLIHQQLIGGDTPTGGNAS
jgi:hypothetical protein